MNQAGSSISAPPVAFRAEQREFRAGQVAAAQQIHQLDQPAHVTKTAHVSSEHTRKPDHDEETTDEQTARRGTAGRRGARPRGLAAAPEAAPGIGPDRGRLTEERILDIGAEDKTVYAAFALRLTEPVCERCAQRFRVGTGPRDVPAEPDEQRRRGCRGGSRRPGVPARPTAAPRRDRCGR